MRVQDEIREIATWLVKDLGLGIHDYRDRSVQGFYRLVRSAILREFRHCPDQKLQRLGSHVRDRRKPGLAKKIRIVLGASREGRAADLEYACAAVAAGMIEYLNWRTAKRAKARFRKRHKDFSSSYES